MNMKVNKVVLRRITNGDTPAAWLQFEFENGTVVNKIFKFDSEDLKNYQFKDVINRAVHVKTYTDADKHIFIDTQHFITSNNLVPFIDITTFLGVF